MACYHCRQAAAKALQGLLYFRDTPFRKTHALDELAAQCVAIDATLGDVTDEAVALTPFATRFRYTGDPSGPTPDEIAEAIGLAARLLGEVLARLPKETHP